MSKLIGFILIGIGGFLTSSFVISNLIMDRSYNIGNWTGNAEESNLVFLLGIILSSIWYVPFFVFGIYLIKKSNRKYNNISNETINNDNS